MLPRNALRSYPRRHFCKYLISRFVTLHFRNTRRCVVEMHFACISIYRFVFSHRFPNCSLESSRESFANIDDLIAQMLENGTARSVGARIDRTVNALTRARYSREPAHLCICRYLFSITTSSIVLCKRREHDGRLITRCSPFVERRHICICATIFFVRFLQLFFKWICVLFTCLLTPTSHTVT